MTRWKSEIYRNDHAQRIKSEYRKLLSVKVSDAEAEKLCLDYAMHDAVPFSWDEGCVWLALALSEWEEGRLTEHTKAQALKWIHTPNAPIHAYTLEQLESTLLSPAPLPKRIKPPSGLRKCPFPVGSLLAYRMISNSDLADTPFWGKYVLLRVIKIIKTPVSFLAPDACFNESMLVGLYNWIGDSIPEPSIVKKLNFTYIVASETSDVPNVFLQMVQDISDIDLLPEALLNEVKNSLTNSPIETCCCLDWICAKGIDSKKVFTLLVCDDSNDYLLSPFFDTKITSYSFAHSIPFDIMLKNRFG